MKYSILEVTSEKIQLHGLKKFTIDEVAAELKISKKTIYKYFSSKDALISEFFNVIIESDRENTLKQLESAATLIDRLNAVLYSYHKLKLPVSILEEAHRFYPAEWNKIQGLKDFKLKLMYSILSDSSKKGEIKDGTNLSVLCKMLSTTADTFLDYNFLSENKLTLKEALGEAINILLYGIINEQ